jgi:hypothetical protein
MKTSVNKRDKFEIALVKAKAHWRRICDDPNSSVGDRQRGRQEWKKAQIARDKALALWRQALAERREARADRRRAQADRRKANAAGGLRKLPDRRSSARRP